MQLIILCLTIFGLAWGQKLPAPYTEHCIVGEKNLYPPPAATKVPWYTVNLDEPAATRWNKIAADYSQQIKDLIGVVKGLVEPIFKGKAIGFVDKYLADWNNRMPQPYQDELAGIAKASGVPLGEVVLYNIFYEIFSVCTSIVAQDPTGKLYHARNLDFGLFLGWDPKEHEWMLTSKLRKMIVNVQWMKGGKPLFKSVQFAGYTGVYNALKKDMFTLTANERFAADGGFMGILDWLMGDNSQMWMTWLTRSVFETATSFTQAKQMLSTTKVMSPVYFILGGTKPGEGCVITRSREKALNVTCIDTTKPNGWYVLETNYDSWKKPLFLDDRRTPGNACMRQLGQKNVGFDGIFNVLSSKTNLNKLTAYTVLMQVHEDRFESYIQTCPNPCWPF